jgi:hypothetical protein
VLDDSDYLLGRYFGDVALAGQARISDIRQPLSHSSGIFIASQDRALNFAHAMPIWRSREQSA